MTPKRPDDVRSVSIIAVPGRVVAVNAAVQEENFPVVVAVKTDRRVGCRGFGVRACRRGRVSETGVVCIKAAVSDPDHHTGAVQADRPVGVLIQGPRFDEAGRLLVSCVRRENGLNPQDAVDGKDRLQRGRARRKDGQRPGEVSSHIERC